MKREIKFRVWLPNANKMFYQKDQYLESFLRRANNFETKFNKEHPKYNNKILLQYTGLKDKNGVEIYESDIVKMINSKWKCVYDGSYCSFRFYSLEFDWDSPIISGKELINQLEVIGNIYENKDLL